MVSQDYIMRMVEQVARMLASVLSHREEGRYEDAAVELQRQIQGCIGIPLETLRWFSPERLLAILPQYGPLRSLRAITLGEMLIVDAELCEKSGQSKAALCSRLLAYTLIAEVIDTLEEEERIIYRQKADKLKSELLNGCDHPYLDFIRRGSTG